MGLLKGKQFFSWEILPVLETARSAVADKVNELIGYESAPGDAMFATSLVRLSALKVDANKRADTDSNGSSAPTPYRSISPFWQEVDAAVSFIPTPEVLREVAMLPSDPSPPASSLSPLVVWGTLAGLGVLGYLWTQKR